VLRRGSFRSPRMGYTGGSRARNPGVNQPGNRTPAAPARRAGGFMGGMFGGLLAGSLLGGMLGGLFNPFGIGTGNGFSLFGLLIWAVILYAAYRLFRRVTGRGK
jgi:predicted lipid-binding transport protein (Tim44 family)